MKYSRLLIAALILIFIISYAISRSENYVRGPEIEISLPINGETTTSPTILIVGRVQRTNALFLNGKSISVDEQGNFNEKIIIFHGVNIITLTARDRFDRMINKKLDIVGL